MRAQRLQEPAPKGRSGMCNYLVWLIAGVLISAGTTIGWSSIQRAQSPYIHGIGALVERTELACNVDGTLPACSLVTVHGLLVNAPLAPETNETRAALSVSFPSALREYHPLFSHDLGNNLAHLPDATLATCSNIASFLGPYETHQTVIRSASYHKMCGSVKQTRHAGRRRHYAEHVACLDQFFGQLDELNEDRLGTAAVTQFVWFANAVCLVVPESADYRSHRQLLALVSRIGK